MKNFYKFSIVSGCGWLLDVLITMMLVQFGNSPFVASMVGAGTAVTFVYVVSLFVVFQAGRISGLNGYVPYVLWQVLSISIASILVAVLAFLIEPFLASISSVVRLAEAVFLSDPLSLSSGIAKALVTPLTLVANFFFMRWLTGWPSLKRDQV